MYWNLRIIKQTTKELSFAEDGEFYGIYEVFYEKGKPTVHTEDPVGVCGDSLEDMLEYQEMLCEAWAAPILNEGDFKD
jgi:hypothetical protein